MEIGKMSLPESLGKKDFSWFKKYYDLTLKGQLTETAEEAYEMLGGKLPKKAKEKPSE